MKFIKNIDFVGQSAILSAGTLVILLSGPYWLFSLFLSECVIAFWQLCSSIVSISKSSAGVMKGKAAHLVLSIIDLTAIAFLAISDEVYLACTILIVLPGVLAVGYYILTIIEINSARDHRGKFLPHTSF